MDYGIFVQASLKTPADFVFMLVPGGSVAMTTRPGENLKNNMAAEKRTISVIGLLKDVEFHMVKAAAEVSLCSVQQ